MKNWKHHVYTETIATDELLCKRNSSFSRCTIWFMNGSSKRAEIPVSLRSSALQPNCVFILKQMDLPGLPGILKQMDLPSSSRWTCLARRTVPQFQGGTQERGFSVPGLAWQPWNRHGYLACLDTDDSFWFPGISRMVLKGNQWRGRLCLPHWQQSLFAVIPSFGGNT